MNSTNQRARIDSHVNQNRNQNNRIVGKKLYCDRFQLKQYSSIGQASGKVNDVEDITDYGKLFKIKKYESEMEFKKEITVYET